MPKYSIIIPVYNVEEHLKKCTDSILIQSFRDYEIILVDDGSTDTSGKLADEISKNNPGLISVIHQKNMGSAGARNTGIELAQGDYIWFIDSDDIVSKDSLELITQSLSENESDILVFDIQRIDTEGNMLSLHPGVPFPVSHCTLKDEPHILINASSPANKVFRRALFAESGIRFLENNWYEDFGTIPKIYAIASSISYIPKALYYYTVNLNSKTFTKNLERNREIFVAMNSIMDFYKEKQLFDLYHDEFEYMTLLNVYLDPSIRVIKSCSSPTISLLKAFKSYLLTNFPDYKNCKYNSLLTKQQKTILKLLDHNLYHILKIGFSVKNKLAGEQI